MRVPPGHRAALEALAQLDEEGADSLLRQVEEAAILQTSTDLARQLKERAGAAGVAIDVDGLVRAAISLATQTKYHGWTLDELATDAARSPDLHLDDDERQVLGQRLSNLVRSEAILLTARAADLQTEHERTFHDARVLTDIRPVFDPDATNPPSAAVVNEVLKIEYFEAGETRALFVALDRRDLERLHDVVERAITKTKTLKAYLDGVGLGYFELEPPQ